MAAPRPSPSTQASKLSVFDYLDYRAFLRAYYAQAKQSRAGFSFRTFSKRAGLRSPNFLKLVIDGERNLGRDASPKFADALGLVGSERDFFLDLVAFDQAADVAEKNRVFERLAACRRFREARRIDRLVHEYLSHWYHPAIRELVGAPDFQEEPRWIAKRLSPPLKERQAAQSLALLLELGLVVRDPGTQKLGLGEPTLTTEHEVSSLGVANFHRQMMERASESIDRIPPAERDFAALTVRVSPRLVTEVKERVHRFRESLAELCDSAPEGTMVYQLNLQWFPLTTTEEER